MVVRIIISWLEYGFECIEPAFTQLTEKQAVGAVFRQMGGTYPKNVFGGYDSN
jgi:hypothetical protein